MGKYSETISEARVALTDTGMNFININESGLKAREYCNELRSATDELSKFDKVSLFGKLKDIMIDDGDDVVKAEDARKVTSLTARVKACGMCKCAVCAKVTQECSCVGCILGSYVIECDGNLERRATLPGVCYADGAEIKETEYRRGSSEIVCVTASVHGTEQRYVADIATGKTRPV